MNKINLLFLASTIIFASSLYSNLDTDLDKEIIEAISCSNQEKLLEIVALNKITRIEKSKYLKLAKLETAKVNLTSDNWRSKDIISIILGTISSTLGISLLFLNYKYFSKYIHVIIKNRNPDAPQWATLTWKAIKHFIPISSLVITYLGAREIKKGLTKYNFKNNQKKALAVESIIANIKCVN